MNHCEGQHKNRNITDIKSNVEITSYGTQYKETKHDRRIQLSQISSAEKQNPSTSEFICLQTRITHKKKLLTLWLPVYEYIVLANQGKTRDISVDLPTT